MHTHKHSYTCTCTTPGYWGTGVYCVDVDECSITSALPTTSPHTCHPTTDCINTDGVSANETHGYTCQCKTGYRAKVNASAEDAQYWHNLTCVDIDECAEGTDRCHDGRDTCTNTIGSYTCDCISPYWGGHRAVLGNPADHFLCLPMLRNPKAQLYL